MYGLNLIGQCFSMMEIFANLGFPDDDFQIMLHFFFLTANGAVTFHQSILGGRSVHPPCYNGVFTPLYRCLPFLGCICNATLIIILESNWLCNLINGRHSAPIRHNEFHGAIIN